MTDLDPQSDPPSQRPVPRRVRRLRDEADTDRPDYVTPIAALVTLVAVMMMTCVPISAVATAVSAENPTDPDVAGPIRTTLIMALVFFFIALLGLVAGIATILRKNWGRRLLLSFAVLTLAFEATAVYLRLSYGIEGTTETAPTRSALTLNLTCVGAVFVAIAVLMFVVLRYFTLPEIKQRFR